MNFEDLQKNWQLQQAPNLEDKTDNRTLTSSIIDNVKKLQRKVIWTNIMMTIVLILTACAFLFILREALAPKSLWFDMGLGLLLGAAMLSAVAQWTKSVPWKRISPDLSSKEYIEQALKSFKFQNTSLRLITPIQMLVSGIGLHLIYVDIFWEASMALQITMHISLLAVLTLVAGLSLYYSRLRYQEEYLPLINELTDLQEQLKKAEACN